MPRNTASEQLHALARATRHASRPLARAQASARSAAIAAMARDVQARATEILSANALDVAAARGNAMAPAMLDRLTLDAERLAALQQALHDIAEQADPIGVTTRSWTVPSGLQVRRVRLPLGVVLMIYESRPNVTCDAAALCIRSGNAVILRGGSEAVHTNHALAKSVRAGLVKAGLPVDAVQLVPTQDRAAIDTLITFDDCIDVVIPRGGEALIRRVASASRIPVLQHYKGVCHVYVDGQADLAMAARIAQNAKLQRPGVCNAMETLLVDRRIATRFLPGLIGEFMQKGVEIRGCAATQALVPGVVLARDIDWDTEFLSLILAIRVVEGVNGAVEHIDRHGTQHTASIVSQDAAAVETFLTRVDASCVLVNASTRFNDGGALGLGDGDQHDKAACLRADGGGGAHQREIRGGGAGTDSYLNDRGHGHVQPRTKTLNSEQLSQRIAAVANDRKAEDIVIVDVRGRCSYTDFLVICSGTSDRHMQAIAELIDDTLRHEGNTCLGREGYREGQWALIDFGSVVAHVFHPFTRQVYNLEEMWRDAPSTHVGEHASEPTDGMRYAAQ